MQPAWAHLILKERLCIACGADNIIAATLSLSVGVEKKRSDVIDLMKDLNVQLDNLCQVQISDHILMSCRLSCIFWKVLSGFRRLAS